MVFEQLGNPDATKRGAVDHNHSKHSTLFLCSKHMRKNYNYNVKLEVL